MFPNLVNKSEKQGGFPMADVIVTSNDNYLVDVDNNSSSTSNYFGVTHDNGTELLRVQENGNVGIGTASPAVKLHIVGGSQFMFNNGNNCTLEMGDDNNNCLDLQYNSASHYGLLQSYASNNPGIFVINPSGGNVGIGKTNPGAKLEILRSASGACLRLDTPDGCNTDIELYNNGLICWTIESMHDNNKLYFWNANGQVADVIVITQGGYLGIGTESPDGGLHVAKGAYSSGYITLEELAANAEPGNAPANSCRIFCMENASGKTTLYAKFQSGLKQEIKPEP